MTSSDKQCPRPDASISMPSSEYTSKLMPHSPEAGDPYSIGDIYDAFPLPISQEWEIDMTKYPYLAYIKSLSTAWPHLRYLADFMEVSTTPLKWKFLKGCKIERQERAQRTNISILDFPPNQAAIIERITTAAALETFLTKPNVIEGAIRLIFVEDLSRQMIETLGANLDIDPNFFRGHIDDYSWYNIRDRWMEPPNLTKSSKKQKWIRIKFVRPRYFKTSESLQKARDESTQFNIYRRPENDSNQWPYLDNEAFVALTRSRISIWVGQSLNENTSSSQTIALILVDPTVQEGFHLWHGYRNWAQVPSMRNLSQPSSGPPRVSLFEDLVYWTLQQCTTKMPSVSKYPGSFAVIIEPTMLLVIAEWLIICEYIKTRLCQIEWRLKASGKLHKTDETIDISFQRLAVWRKLVPHYQEMLALAVSEIGPFATHVRKSSGVLNNSQSVVDSTEDFEDILSDLKNVQNRMGDLQNRTDRIASVIMSTMARDESLRGLQESKNVARLTWLATAFVPLTFLSGLFSMQTDITALGSTLGWYFLAGIPLISITLMVMLSLNRSTSLKRGY